MDLMIAIVLFAISTSVTPGPNNILILASGLNHGIKNSIPHLFGICLGFPIMVVIIGLGLGTLFDLYPILYDLINIAGVGYLLYLCCSIAASAVIPLLEGGQSPPFSFFQAVLFQWINPKAWMMAAGAVSAYTTSSSDMSVQVIYIALVFLIVLFPSVGIWLVFGAGLNQYLKSAKTQKMMNVLMAILLFLSILPVLLTLFNQYIPEQLITLNK